MKYRRSPKRKSPGLATAGPESEYLIQKIIIHATPVKRTTLTLSAALKESTSTLAELRELRRERNRRAR